MLVNFHSILNLVLLNTKGTDVNQSGKGIVKNTKYSQTHRMKLVLNVQEMILHGR